MSPANSSRAAGDGYDALAITDVVLTPASAADRARGLLGYVRCRMAGLRLDGLALRYMTEVWIPNAPNFSVLAALRDSFLAALEARAMEPQGVDQ